VPVVLHTGLAGNSRVWREAGYVAGLADFQVVLLDHRGHGRSEAPSDPRRHTVADYVGDVIALADELGFDRFVFWGYSDGARVDYELAATQPGRVLALVAAGGVDAPEEDPTEWHEAAGLVREQGMRGILGDETVPAWVISQLVDESDPEVVARQLECFAAWTPWPLLANIEAPTLLVAGEHESEHLTDAGAALRDGRTVVIPNLGHLGAFLHSELVLPHVVPFLRSVTHS
jgi:pimeloyl-ACP methyl ester carboxylesterase